MLALDARVVLHDPALPAQQLPRPAARPYPAQYVSPWTMKNGTEVTVRPIRPEDEPLMVAFHETLSDRSLYSRYFSPLSLSTRVAHERLARLCFVDYDREIALARRRKILCSVVTNSRGSAGWSSSAMGTELFRRLIEIARMKS